MVIRKLVTVELRAIGLVLGLRFRVYRVYLGGIKIIQYTLLGVIDTSQVEKYRVYRVYYLYDIYSSIVVVWW